MGRSSVLFQIIILVHTLILVFTDVYTSVSQIESLFDSHKNLPVLMNDYVKAEKHRLQEIRTLADDFLSKKFINEENSKDFLDNPVNIYHLIKRLTIDVNPLLELMRRTSLTDILKSSNASYKMLHLSNEEDLKGVAIAINRLQQVYELNVSSLAKGQLGDTIINVKEMSADDCFEMGQQLFLTQKFISAIPWLEEALKRNTKTNNRIKGHKEELLLQYLAESHIVNENITEANKIIQLLLKLDPENYMAEELQKEINNFGNPKYYSRLKLDKSDEGPLIDFGDAWGNYERLCRGEYLISTQKEAKLKCYITNNKSYYLIIQPIKVEDVYIQPWITIFHNVITNKELEILQKLAIPHLQHEEEEDGTVAEYRISKSAWINEDEHQSLQNINKRLEAITGLNIIKSSDYIQISNYGVGGHHEPHVDFDLNETNPFPDLNLGNRIATFLTYIDDDYTGGLSCFPSLKFSIRPNKGSTIFWYNLFQNGNADYNTEHADCPVLSGSKWVANKWIHAFHQEFQKPCGLNKNDFYDDSFQKINKLK